MIYLDNERDCVVPDLWTDRFRQIPDYVYVSIYHHIGSLPSASSAMIFPPDAKARSVAQVIKKFRPCERICNRHNRTARFAREYQFCRFYSAESFFGVDAKLAKGFKRRHQTQTGAYSSPLLSDDRWMGGGLHAVRPLLFSSLLPSPSISSYPLYSFGGDGG